MRVAEVDRRPERLRDLDVPGHLGAPVPGDRPQQAAWQIPHPLFQCLVQRLAIPTRQMQQPDQSGLPFDESTDRGSLPLTDDEIPLPMTGFGSVGRFEGAVVDRQHRLLEPGSAPLCVLVSAPVIASRPKRGPTVRCQLRGPQERGSGLVKDLIDALVTQLQLRVLRESEPQVPADLFRAPPLPQHLHHRPPKDRLDLDAASRVACPPSRRLPMRIERPIAPPNTAVAPQLSRDCRGGAVQPRGDLAHPEPRPAQVSDLDAFVLRQESGADPAHQEPVKRWHKADHLPLSINLRPTSPVVPRRPGHANFTGCRADAPSPLPQLHEPLTLSRQRTTPRPLLHTTTRCQHDLHDSGSVATMSRNHPSQTAPLWGGMDTQMT